MLVPRMMILAMNYRSDSKPSCWKAAALKCTESQRNLALAPKFPTVVCHHVYSSYLALLTRNHRMACVGRDNQSQPPAVTGLPPTRSDCPVERRSRQSKVSLSLPLSFFFWPKANLGSVHLSVGACCKLSKIEGFSFSSTRIDFLRK